MVYGMHDSHPPQVIPRYIYPHILIVGVPGGSEMLKGDRKSLKSFYHLSTFDVTHVRKDTRLSPPSHLEQVILRARLAILIIFLLV